MSTNNNLRGGDDMVVDDYEQFNNHNNSNDDDDADVVIVSPSGSGDEPEPEPDVPRADDYDTMIAKYLPVDDELETIEQTYNTWHIQNWSKMEQREEGPIFHCGGSPWRVLFFPYGNQVDYASFYLEHGYGETTPPQDWYACVQFALVLWKPSDPTRLIPHFAHHRFNADEGDWGFTRFCELRKLFYTAFSSGGETQFVENDEAYITAYVRVVKDPTGVLWHSFQNYNSKKETGMVGLKNQGATCYLNSLLQSLYFTNSFRKAVYEIPTEEEDNKSNSAWTLQRLFYSLQTNENAVSTQELTSSFGWESRQIFEQQDVQELSRKLMERLEEKMKGTQAETALPDLFVGKSKTYISCVHVDYESSRIEDFWDIQLNVRGNRTLDDSFKDYIQVETLDGENKYDAGPPYGLQQAKKGVIFESFPPVLHLHLKRFEYDINRDAMMKLNDRHEFPEEFDASPYLSADADKSESWVYQLHGALIHSGDLNAGHYYAFLKPTKDGYFYRFDDDRVVRATMKETLEESYGGEYPSLPNGNAGVRQPFTRTYSTKRSMNAYMLVYIRKSRLDDVLVDVQKDDVPLHIERRLAEDKAELARRKKEREEQHLYMNVGLLSDDSFKHHHSFDLTSTDLEPDDPAAVKVVRVLRTMLVSELVEQIAEERGLQPEQIRLWAMVNRQNKTIRPDQPFRDTSLTLEEAFDRYGSKGISARCWIETSELDPDGKVEWTETQGANDSTLVFLKHFDVAAQDLTGVGHVFVKKHAKVGEIGGTILDIMGWPAGTQLLLYEEIKHAMIDPMKPKQTFHLSEIRDGDIICFQKHVNDVESSQTILYPDARQYYDYLLNRIVVRFESIQADSEEGAFDLTLSRKMNYDQFSTKVGEHLKVDPTHLRFAPIMTASGRPKPFIKRTVTHNLGQILASLYTAYGYVHHRSDALYYEVLETSLSEYEMKKSVKLNWLPEGITKAETFDVLVAKNGNISDLLLAFQKKASLDDDSMQTIRVYEAHSNKVFKELHDNYGVAGIPDSITLYAERTPEDELKMEETEFKTNAFNFDKEPVRSHGVPFTFVVKPGEAFKDTKDRLSERIGIKGKQFEKIKFAVVPRTSFSSPRYLEDDDILADLLTDPDDQLGLDHVNKNRTFWNRSDSFFIR